MNSTDLALDMIDEDILGRAAQTLERFEDQPLVDARLRGTIGQTYVRPGRYERAEPQLEAALAIHRRELGSDHPTTLGSMSNLAVVYQNQSRYDQAEHLFLETPGTQERVLGDDHPDTAQSYYNLACLEAVRGDPGQAMDWLRQSVQAGWASADWMSGDDDLESLHGAEFDGLVDRARRDEAEQRTE